MLTVSSSMNTTKFLSLSCVFMVTDTVRQNATTDLTSQAASFNGVTVLHIIVCLKVVHIQEELPTPIILLTRSLTL